MTFTLGFFALLVVGIVCLGLVLLSQRYSIAREDRSGLWVLGIFFIIAALTLLADS